MVPRAALIQVDITGSPPIGADRLCALRRWHPLNRYDAGNMVGKVLEQPGVSTITETRTVNDLNQITANTVINGPDAGSWTYTWDLSGNLTQKKNTTTGDTWNYTWSDENRLTQVQLPGGTTVSYTYDVLGRMLSRLVSTDTAPSTFVWDGMDCVMETSPTGVVTRYNVVNGVLMSFIRDGYANAYFDSAHYDTDDYSGTIVGQTLTDALSSVRAVTDDEGNVIANYDTDAWGNSLPSTSDGVPNGGFAYRYVGGLGVRWDADTGMYYMRQRWYDSQVGRFVTRDEISATRIGNVYAYALDCPTTYLDPTGLATIDPRIKTTFGGNNVDAAMSTVNSIAQNVNGGCTGSGVDPSGNRYSYNLTQAQMQCMMTSITNILKDPNTKIILTNATKGESGGSTETEDSAEIYLPRTLQNTIANPSSDPFLAPTNIGVSIPNEDSRSAYILAHVLLHEAIHIYLNRQRKPTDCANADPQDMERWSGHEFIRTVMNCLMSKTANWDQITPNPFRPDLPS